MTNLNELWKNFCNDNYSGDKAKMAKDMTTNELYRELGDFEVRCEEKGVRAGRKRQTYVLRWDTSMVC